MFFGMLRKIKMSSAGLGISLSSFSTSRSCSWNLPPSRLPVSPGEIHAPSRIALLTAGYKGLFFQFVKIKLMLLLLLSIFIYNPTLPNSINLSLSLFTFISWLSRFTEKGEKEITDNYFALDSK